MVRRNLVMVSLALAAGLIAPLGPAHASAAAGFDSLVFSPKPIAQPGTLGTSQTTTICVQPELTGGHVAASVFLSFYSGVFAGSSTGGSAAVGSTALTTTPQSFATSPKCTLSSGIMVSDGIAVTYTSPATTLRRGRDMLFGADASNDVTPGSPPACTAGVCGKDVYVFSPVTGYSYSVGPPIAPTGTLAGSATVSFTVTALDANGNSAPGATVRISFSTNASPHGSATATDINGTTPLTSTPAPFIADDNGAVALAYTTAASPPSSGTDAVTAQNGVPPTFVPQSDTYTYGLLPGQYHPVAPFRICDTRPDGPQISTNQCNNGGAGAPLTPGAILPVQATGLGGVPGSGVLGVVVNVTAVSGTQASFFTVWPTGAPQPNSSNLNFPALVNIANLVQVGVGVGSSAGEISVYNQLGTVNLVIDIEGYFAIDSNAHLGLFNPIAPVRICDTRADAPQISTNQCNNGGAGMALTGGTSLTFNAVNNSDLTLPSTHVGAVVLNVTAINPAAGIFVTAYPGPAGATPPNASNINVPAHTNLPNRVVVPVASDGTVNIYSTGTVDIAVDINGWFTDGTDATATGSMFSASLPQRICDTRPNGPQISTNQCNNGGQGAPLAPMSTRNFNVVSPAFGVPANATAVVLNVTAVSGTAGSIFTLFPGPSGGTPPVASDLNFLPNQNVPNLVVVEVGSDGTVNLFNANGTVDAVVDLLGFYS